MKRQLRPSIAKTLLAVTIVMTICGSGFNDKAFSHPLFVVAWIAVIYLNLYVLNNYTNVFKEEK